MGNGSNSKDRDLKDLAAIFGAPFPLGKLERGDVFVWEHSAQPASRGWGYCNCERKVLSHLRRTHKIKVLRRHVRECIIARRGRELMTNPPMSEAYWINYSSDDTCIMVRSSRRKRRER